MAITSPDVQARIERLVREFPALVAELRHEAVFKLVDLRSAA